MKTILRWTYQHGKHYSAASPRLESSTTRSTKESPMDLGEQMIMDFMHKPLRFWRWAPPPVPDFASPMDLANVMKGYRAKIAEIKQETGRTIEDRGDLSDG